MEPIASSLPECLPNGAATRQLSPTNCPRPIVINQLSSTNCHQPIATHQLSPTNCHQPIVIDPLSPTNCHQPIVINQLNKLSPTHCHQPIVINQLLPTRCHLPICYPPIVTNQFASVPLWLQYLCSPGDGCTPRCCPGVAGPPPLCRCDLCGVCVCAAVICVAGSVFWCSPGGPMYAPALPRCRWASAVICAVFVSVLL